MIYKLFGLLLSLLGAVAAGYYYGHEHATNACDARELKRVQGEVTETGRVTGETNETEAGTLAGLSENDKTFEALRAGVNDGPIAVDPHCGLDARGLRLWNAANRGEHRGAAASGTGAMRAAVAGGEIR